MGSLKKVSVVKLVTGMIANERNLFQEAEGLLQKKLGPIDFESEILKFNFTAYYRKEMGDNLLRKFISFEKLINPLKIIEIKLFTNRIEQKFSTNSKRSLNIDPGYLNEGKLVLVSTKDNLQRMYLGKGIYGEITLYYKDGDFQDFIWTYPDYRIPEYKNVFKKIRESFRKQIGRK